MSIGQRTRLFFWRTTSQKKCLKSWNCLLCLTSLSYNLQHCRHTLLVSSSHLCWGKHCEPSLTKADQRERNGQRDKEAPLCQGPNQTDKQTNKEMKYYKKNIYLQQQPRCYHLRITLWHKTLLISFPVPFHQWSLSLAHCRNSMMSAHFFLSFNNMKGGSSQGSKNPQKKLRCEEN